MPFKFTLHNFSLKYPSKQLLQNVLEREKGLNKGFNNLQQIIIVCNSNGIKKQRYNSKIYTFGT
jgi:hypothetical protein